MNPFFRGFGFTVISMVAESVWSLMLWRSVLSIVSDCGEIVMKPACIGLVCTLTTPTLVTLTINQPPTTRPTWSYTTHDRRHTTWHCSADDESIENKYRRDRSPRCWPHERILSNLRHKGSGQKQVARNQKEHSDQPTTAASRLQSKHLHPQHHMQPNQTTLPRQ